MITTAILTDPKPARAINWAGHPMKDGEDYYGKPSNETSQKAPQTSVKGSVTRRKRRRGIMSPEQRQAFGDRMRAYWAKKRGLGTTEDMQSNAPTPELPSVSTDSA